MTEQSNEAKRPFIVRREFPTRSVVSAYSGYLFCDIGDIYDVLGFLLDDRLMTHQLPSAVLACESGLSDQHPWLAELPPVPTDLDDKERWCDAVVNAYGPTVSLQPIADAPWVRANAVDDLRGELDGTQRSAVRLLTGLTDEQLDDLGGLPDD